MRNLATAQSVLADSFERHHWMNCHRLHGTSALKAICLFYTISKRGVIRATHFQLIKQQPKLVRCVSGHVYDVIVDLRPESQTYGQWRGFDLTAENTNSLLVPARFGHGYLVIEDSVVSYKCAEVFYGEGDSGIMYNDPDIDIDWPFDRIGGKKNMIISEKDLNLMSFKEYDEKMKCK